jgi:hypothetical protein
MIELGDYNNEDLSVDLVLLMQLKIIIQGEEKYKTGSTLNATST